jgi:Na+-driven multidrug efflux pump
LILLVYFVGPKAKLRLIRPYGSWREMPTAAFNGFSEFLNETSSGLILLLFNWILMIQVGANGVAAFAVVDYLMYFGILIFYGVGEGVVPLISVNFGGRQPERIRRFLLLAVGLNFLIGLTIVVSLLVWPVQLIGIFFIGSEPKILSLSLIVISIIWPMFIFNGANIAVSAYFTGMHRGTQSAIIAVMRSLIFPVGFILLFWQMFGFIGAFYALPVSEALAFGLSIFLLRTRLPNQLTSMN